MSKSPARYASIMPCSPPGNMLVVSWVISGSMVSVSLLMNMSAVTFFSRSSSESVKASLVSSQVAPLTAAASMASRALRTLFAPVGSEGTSESMASLTVSAESVTVTPSFSSMAKSSSNCGPSSSMRGSMASRAAANLSPTSPRPILPAA